MTPYTGWVQAHDGEEEALERRLLVGEMAPGPDRSPEAGVEALNGIGRVDDRPDFWVEAEERSELLPGVLPQLHDGRIAALPAASELPEAFQRRRFRGSGVDGLEVLCDDRPVLAAGVAEAVPEQVDLMPTSA